MKRQSRLTLPLVSILSQNYNDSYVLIDPTAISAKTRNTLSTRALSKYTHKYNYTCCKIKLLH